MRGEGGDSLGIWCELGIAQRWTFDYVSLSFPLDFLGVFLPVFTRVWYWLRIVTVGSVSMNE